MSTSKLAAEKNGTQKKRPFLKWAGNKYAILDKIIPLLPEKSKRLIEPFVGAGALFVNTHYESNLLCDINPDLIDLYQILQNEGDVFIGYVEEFFKPENNDSKIFYKYRDCFNQTEDKREKSALFIYLNRHGFNGLCRYNSKGKFNVPFGAYKKPYFPRDEMRWFYQKSKNAIFCCGDFEVVLKKATKGDAIYCDPPYTPLSKTASFTSYAGNKFGINQQQRLANWANKLSQKGIKVLISNHNTPFIQDVYSKATITELEVQRFISANGKKRGKASEVLALFQ